MSGQVSAAAYGNTAVGYEAIGLGTMTTAALYNTGVGFKALSAVTAGNEDTAVGYQALTLNTAGANNTALGYVAGSSLTGTATVNNNTYIGAYTGQYITSGQANTAVGELAMRSTYGGGMTGQNNTALGVSALTAVITIGSNNTAIGYQSGKTITTGSSNTTIGYNVASTTLTTGVGNILIGVGAGSVAGGADTAATSTSNFLNIGNTLEGNLLNATGIGSETLYLTSAASSVNYVNITGGATGTGPTIAAAGTDTNVNLTLSPQGTGNLLVPAGLVGIGTTSPAGTLDVEGGTTGIVIGSASSASASAYGLKLAANSVQTTGSNYAYAIYIPAGFQGSSTNYFSIYDASNAYKYFNGYVGIGTTAPPSLLSVYGGGIAVGTYAALGNTAAATGSILASGSVGIGSGSPQASLDLSQKTDAIILPQSSTDPTGVNGMIRYNSGGTPAVKAYINNAWVPLLSSTSTITSLILGTSATVPNPYASSSDTTTGLYTAGTGKIDFTGLGSKVAEISSSGINIVTASNGLLLGGNNGISFPTDSSANGSIAIGYQALLEQNSLAATSFQNTAIGYFALGSSGLTTGAQYNTAVGYDALKANTSGGSNTALGRLALYNNTSGSANVALGMNTLSYNTTGSQNMAIGQQALYSNTTGSYNSGIGENTLYYTTIGSSNTAVGGGVLYNNVAGSESTAIGVSAMGNYNNSATAFTSYNTAVGAYAMLGSSGAAATNTGTYDTAVGDRALVLNGSGNYNSAVGYRALANNTTGNSNTALGYNVGQTLATGSNDILIGVGSGNVAGGADVASSSTSNFLNIGDTLEGNMSNANSVNGETLYLTSVASSVDYVNITGAATGTPGVVTIAAAGTDTNVALKLVTVGTGGVSINATPSSTNPFVVGSTSSNGNAAYLSAAGVWTNASDRRIKENIRPIQYGLDTVMKLDPVAYDMKGSHEHQVGFIAQEVLDVVPEVVGVPKNPDVEHYGLSYGNMVAVTVKAIQELKVENDGLKKQVAALKGGGRDVAEDRWLMIVGIALGIVVIVGFCGMGWMLVCTRQELKRLARKR